MYVVTQRCPSCAAMLSSSDCTTASCTSGGTTPSSCSASTFAVCLPVKYHTNEYCNRVAETGTISVTLNGGIVEDLMERSGELGVQRAVVHRVVSIQHRRHP